MSATFIMRITNIKTSTIAIPLKTVFKTALRVVDTVENVVVVIETDCGEKGIGSAAPAPVITGETLSSILGGIDHIRSCLIGMDVEDHERLFQKLNSCIIGNMSAKAAVDMAIHDLIGKFFKHPLFRLLGGNAHDVQTDVTISLDTLEKMVLESREKVSQGFSVLKIKVGDDPKLDVQRLQAISSEIGEDIKIRIDANQGWTPKEAVYVGKQLKKRNIAIELMEQPVHAKNFEGLKYVREKVSFPVYADESVFSAQDALKLIEMKAVDGINIKLMKCGGIYNAKKIAAIAESAGIPCMIGSMMECHISVTAAAHLAVSSSAITGYDLDAPLFCSTNPIEGGIDYEGSLIHLPESPGLGIEKLNL